MAGRFGLKVEDLFNLSVTYSSSSGSTPERFPQVTFKDCPQRIDRVLTIEGTVDDEQKKRMADIAERTPVTLTLKGGLEIRTTLA